MNYTPQGYTIPYFPPLESNLPEWLLHTGSVVFALGLFFLIISFLVSKKAHPVALGITGIILIGSTAIIPASMASETNDYYAKATQNISQGIENHYNVSEFTPKPTLHCLPNGKTGTDEATWVTPKQERVTGEFKVSYYGESCDYALLNTEGKPIKPYENIEK